MASAPRVRVRFGSDVSWLRVPPTYDALLDKLRGRYNLPPQHTITLLVGGARIMDVDELEAGDEVWVVDTARVAPESVQESLPLCRCRRIRSLLRRRRNRSCLSLQPLRSAWAAGWLMPRATTTAS